MKEQMPKGLTNQSSGPRLNREGDIFMAEPGNVNGEGQQVNKSDSPISSKGSEMSPFTGSPDKILDPGLKAYAIGFETRVREKPISGWEAEELKKEYLKLHELTSGVEATVPTSGGREEVSAQTQPYRDLISEELGRRGVDLDELFIEAIKYSGETGKTLSVGAENISVLSFRDPRLQNILHEINGEINAERVRTGADKPFLSAEFIRSQTARVRNLLDQQIVDPQEATTLLSDLNSFMTETNLEEMPQQEAARGAAGGERRGGVVPRDPFSEITDPILGQFRDRAGNIIEGVRSAEPRINREEYERLYREVQSSVPSEGVSQQQRNQFILQKQALLSRISGEVKSVLRQGRERGETGIKAIEFVAKINNPDEGKDVYDEIDEAIDRENANDQSYGDFIEATFEKLMNENAASHVIEYLLEYGVERILKRADVNPTAQYPQFGFYENINLDSIIAMARIYDHVIGRVEGNEGTAFKYLADLRERRRIMHELQRSMKNLQEYNALVTQSLRSEGLAFVEKQIAGVSQAKMLYEKFTGSELGLRPGWLREDDHKDIDVNIKGFLAYYSNSHHFKKAITDSEGNSIGSRDLRPWELRRAAIVGKSLFAGMQRRAVYTVLGDLPDDPAELYDAPGDEVEGRRLAPVKLIGDRFIADTNTRKIYMENLVHETIRLAERSGKRFGYGAKDKDGNRKGLYGKKEESWALLNTGVKDPQSSSWRGENFFLRQKRYRTEENGTLTLGDYLYQIKSDVGEEVRMSLREAYPHKNDRQIDNIMARHEDYTKSEFNSRVRDSIKRQRLGLGVLIQIGGLGSYTVKDAQGNVVKDAQGKVKRVNNNEVIWENVAELLPSRIAAMFPKEMLAIAQRVYSQPGAAPSGELMPAPVEGGSIPEGGLMPAPVEGQLTPPPAKGEQKPGETKEEMALRKWMDLRSKLFLAEIKRVMDDAQILESDPNAPIGKALEQVRHGNNPGELHDLKYYYEDCGITDEQDIELIKQITMLGKRKTPENPQGKAQELAMMKHAFTPFLDDVPKTDWEKVGDYTFDRLIAGDHTDSDKGWGAVLGILSEPVRLPMAIVAVFKEAKDYLQPAMGLKGENGAQAYLEPHVNAYLRMTRENGLSKWIGPWMKLFRNPRSQMEEGNRQARIALSEGYISEIINGLSQVDVISDDPAELDRFGYTQNERMKKDNKADLGNQIYYWARMIIYMLGPIAGAEFLKVMLPREAAESVLGGL